MLMSCWTPSLPRSSRQLDAVTVQSAASRGCEFVDRRGHRRRAPPAAWKPTTSRAGAAIAATGDARPSSSSAPPPRRAGATLDQQVAAARAAAAAPATTGAELQQRRAAACTAPPLTRPPPPAASPPAAPDAAAAAQAHTDFSRRTMSRNGRLRLTSPPSSSSSATRFDGAAGGASARAWRRAPTDLDSPRAPVAHLTDASRGRMQRRAAEAADEGRLRMRPARMPTSTKQLQAMELRRWTDDASGAARRSP